MNVWFKHLFSCSLLMTTTLISLDLQASESISIWTRKNGRYDGGRNFPKKKEMKIQTSKLKLKELKTYDLQYGKNKAYKGIFLKDFLASYNAEASSDLALLHFKNGMMMPLKLSAVNSSQLFIALKIKDGKKWKTDFPEVAKVDSVNYYRDPNPTRFAGNKLVLALSSAQQKYFNQSIEKPKKFTPLAHTDSLIGIELANEKAYYAQFGSFKKSEIKRGFTVFKRRCQYCHGVNQVGASFGWDYVDPLKVSEKRSTRSLHLFVKYPRLNATKLGVKMPNQVDVTTEETNALWKWIDKVGSSKMKEYRVTASKR